MHKIQKNRATLHLVVEPLGPVLIRSGKYDIDPSRPDLEWVRTRHRLGGETVYLPGSSLKGVIRSQAERILKATGRCCCDPFDQRSSCMKLDEKTKTDTAARFRCLCAACRTFGSLTVAGRTLFCDAYPWPPNAGEEEARQAAAKLAWLRSRTGVAIDRKTGGTRKGALYDLEVLEEGSFYTEIAVTNFQLWQLELLLLVLRDIDEGFVRIGSGKSRGMGRVNCRVERLAIDWVPAAGDGAFLPGLGVLAADRAQDYGLAAAAQDKVELAARFSGKVRPRGLFKRLELEGEEIGEFEQALLEPWKAFLDDPLLAEGGKR